ncbi:MAG: hypothetical protein MJZ34_07245 [Paludibacteraceae bacterium]|nr:hypothetical protein [Paludibacteraceae bacterium]
MKEIIQNFINRSKIPNNRVYGIEESAFILVENEMYHITTISNNVVKVSVTFNDKYVFVEIPAITFNEIVFEDVKNALLNETLKMIINEKKEQMTTTLEKFNEKYQIR